MTARPMTGKKLAVLEKAATPGPWKRIPLGGSSTITTVQRPGRNDSRIPGYAYRDDEHCLAYPFIEDDGRVRHDFVCFSHADAELIEAMRNALPALLSTSAERGMREALERAANNLAEAADQLRKAGWLASARSADDDAVAARAALVTP